MFVDNLLYILQHGGRGGLTQLLSEAAEHAHVLQVEVTPCLYGRGQIQNENKYKLYTSQI